MALILVAHITSQSRINHFPGLEPQNENKHTKKMFSSY